MKKILITPRSFARYSLESVNPLKAKGYHVIVNTTGNPYTYQEFCELSQDVDGIILGVDKVDQNMLTKAKKLKAISRFGVGIDNIDVDFAKKAGIKIARAVGGNSTSVAELTVGFFFALARNVVKNVTEVKRGEWNKSSGQELHGKTVGILGLGAIGREVARISKGIGMNVLGYDPFVEQTAVDIKLVSMSDLLQESDFVTLHMPLTEENKNLINKETLSLMKETAYLVNTARGGLVNEKDLYHALLAHTIAGAAEDVFSTEPPARPEKLLTLDNFLLCSHIASLTANAEKRTIAIAIQNLIDLLEKN